MCIWAYKPLIVYTAFKLQPSPTGPDTISLMKPSSIVSMSVAYKQALIEGLTSISKNKHRKLLNAYGVHKMIDS